MLPLPKFATHVCSPGVAALVLMAWSAAALAADPAQEVATAAAHAGFASQATTIEQAHIIRLSLEDQRRFAEAILNPPAPNKALRRAAKAYKALIASSK